MPQRMAGGCHVGRPRQGNQSRTSCDFFSILQNLAWNICRWCWWWDHIVIKSCLAFRILCKSFLLEEIVWNARLLPSLTCVVSTMAHICKLNGSLNAQVASFLESLLCWTKAVSSSTKGSKAPKLASQIRSYLISLNLILSYYLRVAHRSLNWLFSWRSLLTF